MVFNSNSRASKNKNYSNGLAEQLLSRLQEGLCWLLLSEIMEAIKRKKVPREFPTGKSLRGNTCLGQLLKFNSHKCSHFWLNETEVSFQTTTGNTGSFFSEQGGLLSARSMSSASPSTVSAPAAESQPFSLRDRSFSECSTLLFYGASTWADFSKY